MRSVRWAADFRVPTGEVTGHDAAAVFDPFPVSRQVLEAHHDIDAAVVTIGRKPRPRRLDLMIAATAWAHALPLITSNLDDCRVLEGLLSMSSP